MELSKYVYFYAQKLSIKTGNNKFQDLINALVSFKNHCPLYNVIYKYIKLIENK